MVESAIVLGNIPPVFAAALAISRLKTEALYSCRLFIHECMGKKQQLQQR
jgi:hypothetical protein